MNRPEPSDKRSRSYARMRGTIHLSMGIVYLLLGAFVLWKGKESFNLETTFAYPLGGLMILYGIYRVYRGWQRMTGKAEGW